MLARPYSGRRGRPTRALSRVTAEQEAPHWYLAGAGHIGTLAAACLQAAGHGITVLRRAACGPTETTLAYADGRASRPLSLPTIAPQACETPIQHLIVACKTPYTRDALAGLNLAANATVIRLQNGIGSLDGLLGSDMRQIEAVTTNAVKGSRAVHEVVAENATWMGDTGTKPAWFDGLAGHWPGLVWAPDIRYRQWRKLVANAAINPLTAIYDVPNGRLVEDPALGDAMAELVAEADCLLCRLDSVWPGDSLAAVRAMAEATAGNMSSMRADRRRGAATEIDAINGWLLREASRIGLPLPAHRRMVDRLAAAPSVE